MRRKNHPIIKADAVHHIYQNTCSGYLLFYSVKDYLVLLSLIGIAARRYGIHILGICMMPDHIHLIVYVSDPDTFRAFVRDYTSRYTVCFNNYYNFTGSLFNTPYGGVPKYGHKKVRSAIAYLYNNPVEGHLCLKAEDFRWHFLAYADTKYPFSEKMRIDLSRWELRKALYTVKSFRRDRCPLDYPVIERITKNLSPRELQQFTDYTVRKYNPVDYSALARYYGSYSQLLTAINSNTGAEYDMEEDTFAKDYSIFLKMIRLLLHEMDAAPMKEILALPYETRQDIGRMLMRRTGASAQEVSKLLRL